MIFKNCNNPTYSTALITYESGPKKIIWDYLGPIENYMEAKYEANRIVKAFLAFQLKCEIIESCSQRYQSLRHISSFILCVLNAIIDTYSSSQFLMKTSHRNKFYSGKTQFLDTFQLARKNCPIRIDQI